MNDFTVELSELADAVLLRLSGEIRTDVGALDRHVTRLLARRPTLVVIDLSGLRFCSSLGMGSIVALKRDMDRLHCKVTLAGAQSLVWESFRRARVAELFDAYPTADDAVAERHSS